MDRPLKSFPSSHPILVGEGGGGGECSDWLLDFQVLLGSHRDLWSNGQKSSNLVVFSKKMKSVEISMQLLLKHTLNGSNMKWCLRINHFSKWYKNVNFLVMSPFKALWHVAFCTREQLFLRINKMNSRNWQVGKSPTWLHELDDLPTSHRLV